MKNPEEIFYVFTKNSNPHSLYLWLDHNEFSKTFHQDLYKLCYDGKNVFLKNHYYDYAEFIQTTFKNFQKLSKTFKNFQNLSLKDKHGIYYRIHGIL